MRVFRRLIAAGAAALFQAFSPAAAGQAGPGPVYFESTDTFARVEQSAEGAIEIGADKGRNYFRLLNKTVDEATFEVTVKSVREAADGGAVEAETVKEITVGPGGMSDRIFLDDAGPPRSWVADWALLEKKPAPRGELADREAAAFYRVPPSYPQECMIDADPREEIRVGFSVTPEGLVDEIRIRSVTNGCLAEAAHRSVRQWVYAPAIVDGAAAAQHDMVTQFTFNLSD